MPLDVLVTLHARKRAGERCGIGVGLAAHEVRAAIAAGRVSVREPAWAAGPGGPRRADRTKTGAKRGHLRWVWPAEQTRAYLIARRGGQWIVITVVAATVRAAAA